LVSPFVTGLDKSNKDFRDSEYKLKIYADSGGFQIAMRNERVASLDVLRWQERIADVGFTVDVPPHSYLNINGTTDYPKNYFLKCMKQSNKNADLMWRCKVNDGMQLWGVIQGRTINELKMWYNDLTKDHEYDGYCISLSIHKSGTICPWIEQLRFAKTISKRIHFLGSSSPIFSLVLARFSKLMNRTYTYDTSSSTIGVRYAKYMIPETFKQITFSINEGPLDKLPCSGPVCSKYSVTEMRYNLPLVALHNLYTQINFCKFANIVSTDDKLFKPVLNKILNIKQYQKYRFCIEAQLQKLFNISLSSSIDNSETIAKIQEKILKSKEVGDIDKEFLQQFTLKFMELKDTSIGTYYE